jgi:hypothetical protein
MSDTLEKIYAKARVTDPLFGDVIRDFQPSIEQVVQVLDIDQTDYNPPSGRERINFSLRPDLVTDVQGFAAAHDMSVSTAVDVLLRVALGDYAQWWNENGTDDGEAK